MRMWRFVFPLIILNSQRRNRNLIKQRDSFAIIIESRISSGKGRGNITIVFMVLNELIISAKECWGREISFCRNRFRG